MANDATPTLGPARRQMMSGPAKVSAHPRTPHIAVIEKNALIRECVARCLAQGLGHDVLLCSSIEDWLQIRKDGQTSLLIVCAWHGEGTYAIPHLFQTAMRQRIIVMSNIEDIELIRMTLEQEFRGYIPASLPLEVAIEAIRLVEAGGVFAAKQSFGSK